MPRLTVLTACLALVAAVPAAAQDSEPDTRPPTSMEQALAEHVCGAAPSSSTGDVHEACVHAQFRALRAEFGYDLSSLATEERHGLDASCSRLRKPENYDPYLNCLTARLIAIREARPRGGAGPSYAEVFGLVSAATRPIEQAKEAGRGWSVALWVIVGILVGVAGAAGAVLAPRLKKQMDNVTPTCQRCGAVLKAASSLCPPCRHEMGLAAKQAIADRAAEKLAEDARRQAERHQAEERQRLAEEQAAQEQQRLEELKSRLEREGRERPHAAPPPTEAAAPVGADPHEIVAIDESDPFRILGVSREATPEEIEAAYRACAAKYDEAGVAHFGDAVRAHYQAKAEAVERAYAALAPASSL